MSDPFAHKVFHEAIADMKSQGLCVTAQPERGAQAYAIVGGRSNARWWLVPLQSGRVAASGLALFQPLLVSARLMKTAAVILSLLGLSRLWVRRRVYISGEPALGQYFSDSSALSYAYFTGTDSPHRKIAVQIMDGRGRLLGFAKFSRNPAVAALLVHEATTLHRVHALGLQTVHIPKVLFAGQHGDGTLLLTDTLKTVRTASTTRFMAIHQVFLRELARATALAEPRQVGALTAALVARINRVRPQLDQAWCQRLDAATKVLAAQPDLPLPIGLSHGDFTPWNTFLANGRLYVFDWEYAEEACPHSNDIIHFVLNEPHNRSLTPSQKLTVAKSSLIQPWTGIAQKTIPVMLIVYLLTQSLRQIERQTGDSEQVSDWDGALEQSGMLDTLITGSTGP